MTVKKQRLYKIVRQHRYNGGRGCDELHREECLYCGYDRGEALRVYHEHRSGDSMYAQPGMHYRVTKCLSREVITSV